MTFVTSRIVLRAGRALVYYPWASGSGREAAGSAPKLALFVAEFAFSFFLTFCDHTHTDQCVCARPSTLLLAGRLSEAPFC